MSNSHDAIIDEDTFNLVQAELERRSNFRSALRDNSVFSTKIICGECGYFYGRKVLHSNSKKHRKVVWYCNHRYDGDEKCASPSISESDIKKYYLEARGYTENTQSYMGYDSDMVKKLSRKGKVEIVKDAASFVVLDETGRRAWKSDYVYHYVQRRQWPWLAQGWGTLDFALEALFYALAFHFIFRTEYGWYAGGCMLLVYVYDVLMIRAALRKRSLTHGLRPE